MFDRIGQSEINRNVENDFSENEINDIPDIENFYDGSHRLADLPSIEEFSDEIDAFVKFPEYAEFSEEDVFSEDSDIVINGKILDFVEGKMSFEEIKEIFAEYYADAVNSNRPWSWGENIFCGDMLTAGQRKKIREYAIENEMISVAETRYEDGKIYADFSKYKVFECDLTEDKWNATDMIQFDECNRQLKEAIEENSELRNKFTEEQLAEIKKGKTPSGYTWHHSEKDGHMELVPFGVHNSTNHCGGRSEGNWADAPRQ